MKDEIAIITILFPILEVPRLLKLQIIVNLTIYVAVYGMFYLLESLMLREGLLYQLFWVGLIGTRLFMDVIMNMVIAVVSLIVQLGIPLYIPHWGFMAILIWPAIAMITLGIRRLHDSLLSGLWIIGLFVPYINIFVSYHLLFKNLGILKVKIFLDFHSIETL